jgi:hypothetical protein
MGIAFKLLDGHDEYDTKKYVSQPKESTRYLEKASDMISDGAVKGMNLRDGIKSKIASKRAAQVPVQIAEEAKDTNPLS